LTIELSPETAERLAALVERMQEKAPEVTAQSLAEAGVLTLITMLEELAPDELLDVIEVEPTLH